MIIFSDKPSSKEIANERLKLILINDRNNVSREILEMIKLEILDVIAKYFEIDKSAVDIKVISNEIENIRSSRLVAKMPIKKCLNKQLL
ncbi:cell division topological specificity factor MinE [Clostridium hydrogenum]|uniref:cell division topological specificity factor MinE n=1 Tax=Clostridium hydrogenum TaxID=2855764 RepID=UPI001F1FC891